MSITKLSVCALIVSFCTLSAHAGLIVDGRLNDWGVTVADNNGSNFTTWSSTVALLGSHVDDTDDFAGHSFFLDPNYGGQDFDAEMMAVAVQSNRLFISIVTGQRPDNGFKYFEPGDIRIETSLGTYGIEVGGGKGGNGGSAINDGASGSTYKMNSNGDVTDHYTASTPQVAGSIWADVDWLADPIAPHGPVQFKIDGDSTLVGQADYVFTRNSYTSQHAVIELAFDLDVLEGAMIQSVHWRPTCGNDELNVQLDAVPEPTTIAFLALGSVAFLRRTRHA